MKVLVDYHHGNLLYSLYLLFEKRLGFEMYRPVGFDWFTNGYFKVAEPYGNAQDTINQYLGFDSILPNLNKNFNIDNNIYYIQDSENNLTHRAITFEQFKKMNFDLIVASHPLHTNWIDLLQYQPNVKFIMQIGNEGQTSNAKNILCSTGDFISQEYQNVMYYHQEFDTSEYVEPTNHTIVKSFVIALPEPETYFLYKEKLPEFNFQAYGVNSPDGTVHGGEIPHMMNKSGWGYHVKPFDGYGHVIFKWFASGRPLITKVDYYKGKKAYPLLEDLITCIDIGKRSVEENIELIRFYSQPEEHKKMCKRVLERFQNVCNFNAEANNIQEWMNIIERR